MSWFKVLNAVKDGTSSSLWKKAGPKTSKPPAMTDKQLQELISRILIRR